MAFALARLVAVTSALLAFHYVSAVAPSVTEVATEANSQASQALRFVSLLGHLRRCLRIWNDGTTVMGYRLVRVQGPWDKVYEWANDYTAAHRATAKAQVGVDYEDFAAFEAGTGAGENWLTSFTTQLRTILPVAVAPWFSPRIWGGGGYLAVDAAVGDIRDWYKVQRGQPSTPHARRLINESSTTWPSSALLQICASSIALDKLVVGKPAGTGYANNGFMDAATLAGCLVTAKDVFLFLSTIHSTHCLRAAGGAMVWEGSLVKYPGAKAARIETVRSVCGCKCLEF
ncbi:glycoside hydrolase family 18 protein [Mycena maculata]|uniref:Glycoside hydrolase family 18 protein n=1 Tax=Mycena maculata TaxID=230809 RepID=A0AAD7NKX6_9AGAR|nr:glycoside hydrolase family 18 protein [Mycena maculata]